jgi:hypothetical protein
MMKKLDIKIPSLSNKANVRKDFWWIPDDTEVWTLATQCSEELPNGCVNFLVEKTQKVVAYPKEKCLPAPASQIAVPEDLVYIPEVNSASILYCIRTRFIERKIYTNIGLVLMSINPFELIPGLYGKTMIQKYENPMVRNLPAHVYIVASRAFYNMAQSGLNQSILISGESGAGKTEATKQCLSFLADLAYRKSQKANRVEESKETGVVVGEDKMLGITDRILFASPILESFGNAKTLRNNNSSRFGKWMVLSFDQFNILHSSNIISYLLEKSRVTQRDLKERNYHIFYQLLRGVEKETLDAWNIVPETRHYRFLATDNDFEAIDLQDGKTFQETYHGFLKVGFTHEETMNYFRIVAAILQLGNIVFTPTRDGEACTIKNPEYVEYVAEKLSVNQQTLAQAMISRSIESGKGRKSIICINLNPQKAQETRDTLARSIYDKLFNEIISNINQKNRESNNSMNAPSRFIGLLDIFGFEIFQENSFEQLCINYCNEMLQYHFNFVIFTSEKNLYATEGIYCETIEFQDNTEVIREIEQIFKALDEEARIPKGTSKTWYDKLKRNFKVPCISFPTRRTGDIFVVKHYAGDVDYIPIEFMDKNIEVLNNDLFNAMASSKDNLVYRLFTRPPENMSGNNNNHNSGTSLARGGRKRSEGRISMYDSVNEMAGDATKSTGPAVPSGKPPTVPASTLTNKSISWRFINQLNSLTSMLRETQSHFIRCIKSNDSSMAQRFDSQVVFKQLTYSGIFEVVKIQQSGLPCRLPHLEFLLRYRCLVPSKVRYQINTSKDLLASLMKLNHYELNQAKPGINLTFFSSTEQKLLESNRDLLLDRSTTQISRFLQMKTRHYCYQQILKYFREFHIHNNNLDSVPATKAFKQFSSSCEKLNALVGFQILNHQIEIMKRHLELCDARVELIEESNGKVDNKTVDGILSLNDIIAKAIELEITTHPVIIECKNIVSKYNRTLEFVDIIQSTKHHGYESPDQMDYDNYDSLLSGSEDSGYGIARRKKSRRMTLNGLTKHQLDECIQSLMEFKDIIPVASTALETSLKHKEKVESEYQRSHRLLEENFRLCCVMFDPYTGDITLRNGDEGAEAYLALQKLVNENENSLFHGRDTQILFEDCRNFITLMEDFVASNEAFDAMQFIRSSSLGKTENKVFLEQLPEFQKWSNIQMAPQSLRDALNVGMIPDSDIGNELPVSYSNIEEVETKLYEIAEPPPLLQTAILVGNYIIDLRKAFLEKNWTLVEEVVEKASQDNINNGIFDDYPSLFDELHNSHCQVTYHGFLSDLVYSISEGIIQSISFDMDSWVVLVSDLTEDLALIKEIKHFANAQQSNKLLLLLPLFENILQLRSLLYSYEIEFVKKLMASIREDYKETIESFALHESIEKEFTACDKLIMKLELEDSLNLNVLNYLMPSYAYAEEEEADNEEVNANDTTEGKEKADSKLHASPAAVIVPSKNINRLLKYHELFPSPQYQFQKHTDELEKVLGQLNELSSNYYKEMNFKITYTKLLLTGRRLLLNDEMDLNCNYFELLKTYEKEIYQLQKQFNLEEFQLLILQNKDFKEQQQTTTNARRRSSTMDSYQKEKEEEQKNFLKDEKLFYSILKEFQVICNELFRRYIFQELIFICSSEMISGTVDVDIHVNQELYEICLKKFNQIIELMQLRYSVNKDKLLVSKKNERRVSDASLLFSDQNNNTTPKTAGNNNLPALPDATSYLISKDVKIRYPEYIPIEYMNNLQALVRFTHLFFRVCKILIESKWEVVDGKALKEQESNPGGLLSSPGTAPTATTLKQSFPPLITNYELVEILIEMENSPHGGGHEIKMIQKEMEKIQLEIKARIMIRSLRHELENIKVENTDELPTAQQQQLTAEATEANTNNNAGSMKRINVDLKALKASIKAVEVYQGKQTVKLVKLSYHIVNLIELLLKNQTDKIHQKDLEKASQEYRELHLNNTNIDRVFHHVRIHNFLRELIELLINQRQDIGFLLKSIQNLQKSILRIISFESNPTNFKFILWLKAAYYYCKLCSIMEEKNNWIAIIEMCNELDEFIQIYLMPLLYEMLKNKIRFTQEQFLTNASIHGPRASFSLQSLTNSPRPQAAGGLDYTDDVIRFMEIVINLTKEGYQLALSLKLDKDETEKQKTLLALSPVDSMKKEIREYDLQNNLYGIGHLKNAGYTSKQILAASTTKFDAKYLWAYNFDLSFVRRYSSYNYSARELLYGGYKLKELYNSGFTPAELFQTTIVTINDLINIGLTINQLKESGIDEDIILKELLHSENKQLIIKEISNQNMNANSQSLSNLFPNTTSTSPNASTDKIQDITASSSPSGMPTFSLQHLIKLGYKLKDLEEFDFTILELRSVGFSINEIYDYTSRKLAQVKKSKNSALISHYKQSYSIKEFIKAGFPVKLLINLFPLKEFHNNGFTFQELRKLGVDNDDELYNAGYVAELELEALSLLFQATHGAFWKHKTNWNNYEKPLNTWFGVTTAMDPILITMSEDIFPRNYAI